MYLNTGSFSFIDTYYNFVNQSLHRALEASGAQQFQLLPSVDTSGHGTAVAGIAAGSSAAYQGAAQPLVS